MAREVLENKKNFPTRIYNDKSTPSCSNIKFRQYVKFNIGRTNRLQRFINENDIYEIIKTVSTRTRLIIRKKT